MCSPLVDLSAGTSSPLSKDCESVVLVLPSVFTQTVCPNLEAGDTLRGETEAAAVSKYLEEKLTRRRKARWDDVVLHDNVEEQNEVSDQILCCVCVVNIFAAGHEKRFRF